MVGSRLKEIKFVLENCDWITIPGNYIGSFCVTDIKKYIARKAMNYIGEYEVAESFMIEIHSDADRFHKQFGQIQNVGHTKFKRLMDWKDITNIEFEIEDCWDEENTTSKKYSYGVDWHEDDEFDNRYQKTYLSPSGHLYIVISADKDIFDVFDKEEIDDADYIEQHFEWLDVPCERKHDE